MSKPLFTLCGIPKLAMRDGYTGANAHIILPFYGASNGIWFASGQQYTFPGSTIGQYTGRALVGTTKPDVYRKAAGVCLQA